MVKEEVISRFKNDLRKPSNKLYCRFPKIGFDLQEKLFCPILDDGKRPMNKIQYIYRAYPLAVSQDLF